MNENISQLSYTEDSSVINNPAQSSIPDFFIPFSPESPIESNHRNLPHWIQAGTTYFLTFRLADSLPRKELDSLKKQRDGWLLLNPEPWNPYQQQQYSKLFSEKLNEWLDAGRGSCMLAIPDISEIVENSLLHFDRERYILDDYVIMPNHIHVLVSPLKGFGLEKILHSLKSFTAHTINKKLYRQGPVWMDESYDHIVRSKEQLEFYRNYIRENPVKAHLSPEKYRMGR